MQSLWSRNFWVCCCKVKLRRKGRNWVWRVVLYERRIIIFSTSSTVKQPSVTKVYSQDPLIFQSDLTRREKSLSFPQIEQKSPIPLPSGRSLNYSDVYNGETCNLSLILRESSSFKKRTGTGACIFKQNVSGRHCM